MMSGKYFFLVGCCILGNIMAAKAAMECLGVPKCLDLGYKNVKSSCPAGYVGCPFNTAAVVCDQEADTGDFKYIKTTSLKGGWTAVATTYHDRFIVGAGTTSYCGVSKALDLKSSSFPEHTHNNVTMSNGSVRLETHAAGDGVGEGDRNFTVYTTVISDVSKLGNTGTTYTGWSGTSYSTTASSVVPFHKKVRGAFYTSPIKSATSGGETIALSAPECAELGYVDTVSNCPGTYVKCPFDSSAVMCDLQAQAGEIKFSLQSGDHNGWLLCNGRALSSKGDAYAKSELSSLMTTLPDYRAMFLKISSSASDTIQVDRVPAHTHGVYTSSMKKPGSSTDYKKSGNGGNYYALKSGVASRYVESSSFSPKYGSKETAPRHYIANVFIYSGKLNVTN